MVQIICVILSSITTIAVAFLSFKQQQQEKRNAEERKKSDARSKTGKKERHLCLQMQDATLELSIVCANALAGGHNNGNVEEARQAAKKAKEEYEKFLLELMAEDMTNS